MTWSSAGTAGSRSRGIVAATVIALATLTWLLTWRAPFAEDDYLFLDAMLDADVPTWVGYLTGEGVMDHHYRPLSDPFFFGLLLRGFGGHPLAYHVIFTLAIAASGLLVIDLGRRLGLEDRAAWAAGGVYVSRDFLFPSMVWASGVSDIGSTLWALAFLDVHARWCEAPNARRRALASLWLVLALGTKETAVVAVALALLVSWRLSRAVDLAARAKETARSIWPYALVAAPFVLVQLSMARFDSGPGAELYRLAPGLHTVTRWPVYALWSFAGVRELVDAPALQTAIAVAGYGGLGAVAWMFARRRRIDAAHPRDAWASLALFGTAWLVVSIAPALLAPNRFHTNYVGLGAAGMIWTAMAALFPAPPSAIPGAVPEATRGAAPEAERGSVPETRSIRTVSGWRVALLALLVATGIGLVVMKSTSRLASGGWVDLTKAERLAARLERLRRDLVPEPVPEATIVLFSALGDDIRVLGNPRRRGFGVQSIVTSSVRVVYRRPDLDALVFPPIRATPPEAFSVLYEIVAAEADRAYVIDLAEPAADLSGASRRVVADGAGSVFLARRLATLRP